MKTVSAQDLKEELMLLREKLGPARKCRDAREMYYWLAIDKCAALAARALDIEMELDKRSQAQEDEETAFYRGHQHHPNRRDCMSPRRDRLG